MHRPDTDSAARRLLNAPLATSRSLALAASSVAFLLGVASPVWADAKAGAAIAQKGGGGVTPCMACHGANGEGQAAAGFPRLAGQPQAYLEKQLKEFASGRRKSPQMEPIAKQLQPAQMKNVAEYYAELPQWKPTAAPDQQAEGYALGRHLATRGKWSAGVPACYACHAEGGQGVPPHFPALAGQPRAYTEAQLKAWQSSARNNDPRGLMKSVAMKLTPAEVAAVSLFLENPSLPGKDK